MDKPLGWGRDESGLLMQMAALAELFERWPTVKRWLDEGQGDAVLLDRLRAAARLWDSSDRAADMLWRGKMADEARGFRERYRGELPGRERLFLEEVLRRAWSPHHDPRLVLPVTALGRGPVHPRPGSALAVLVVAAEPDPRLVARWTAMPLNPSAIAEQDTQPAL